MLYALADHECESLEGIYVNDKYVAFAGDGTVAGYNGQLSVWWLPGTETQTWPSIVTANGPGWTNTSNCAGVSCAVVAYKADEAEVENPTWSGQRPRILFRMKGKKLYNPAKDSTQPGGAGAHRWTVPSTWEWDDNAAVCRYNYQRGIYALDRVDQPDQLLIGRGLNEIEAPSERTMVWAALCDEPVTLKNGGTEKRYTVNGTIGAEESFLDAEEKFAAAMGGVIAQPEGSIEVVPGHAQAVVAEITDRDLLNLEEVEVEHFRGEADPEWKNMVVPRYVEADQKWAVHTAPIRRVYADVIEDGGPREYPLPLDLVTSNTQAQRCGEIARRLGRLLKTGKIPLPARFVGLEEGDWIGWTSARHFGGARVVFRIDSYARTDKWQMKLALRQISSSIYDWNPAVDEINPGSVANDNAVPPVLAAPSPGSWALNAGEVSANGVTQPALVIVGEADNFYASAIKFEYRKVGVVEWNDAGLSPRSTTRRTIPGVTSGEDYQVAVSYVVAGEPGPRLILGPLTTGALAPAFDDIGGDISLTDGRVTGKLPPAKADDGLINTNIGVSTTTGAISGIGTGNGKILDNFRIGLQPNGVGVVRLTRAGLTDVDATVSVKFGATGQVYRDDGATRATDALVVTSVGQAATVFGQSPWVTDTTITPGTVTARTQYLNGSGNLDTLSRITDRKLTLLFRADGSTAVTEAAVVTSQGQAATIYAQGTFATKSSAAWGVEITGRPLSRMFDNLLDMANWRIGATHAASGDQFYHPSWASFNSFVSAIGPDGATETILRSVQVSGGSYSAGGTTGAFVDGEDGFDPKKPLLSAFFYRNPAANNAGQETYGYFGPALDTVGTGVKTLAGVTDGNPYFFDSIRFPNGASSFGSGVVADKWYLWIGLVHGSAYAGSYSGVTGIYDPATGAKLLSGTEFKHDAAATKAGMRFFPWNPTDGHRAEYTRPVVWQGDDPAGYLRRLIATVGARLGAGGNLLLEDGVTRGTNAGLVTAQGQAATIYGQAATATSSDFSAVTGTTKPETYADVNKTITDGPAAIEVQYASDGSTTELPVSQIYKLTPSNGSAYTSGVTWAVAVITGTITASMSGTGSGALSIPTFGSNEAVLLITAAYGGRSYPFTVKVAKKTASAGSPGGGGTGGTLASATTFITFSTTTAAAVTGDLTVTTGGTSVALTAANLTLKGAKSSPSGTWDCAFKWQWWNGTAWADVATEVNSSPDPTVDYDAGSGLYTNWNTGSVTCNATKTGLTAGTSQKFRLMARITGGASKSINITGEASAQG
ncbi:phage tail protein [Flavisphingopyxis soli]|uniref:phage tail protein n=1 Tax=Flavisphingopyxis soli TaxID=2601267 RepID=UPI0013758AD6|nr:phage tail protein [Sphingorhabdus soli]